MFRPLVLSFWVLSVSIGNCQDAAKIDDAKQKLSKAKMAFAAETDAIRKEAKMEFQNREALIRKRVEKEKLGVDEVKILLQKLEREQANFEAKDTLPDWMPDALLKKDLLARKSMDSAYESAIKAFLFAKATELADETERERTLFKSERVENFPDAPRTDWAKLANRLSQSFDGKNKGKSMSIKIDDISAAIAKKGGNWFMPNEENRKQVTDTAKLLLKFRDTCKSSATGDARKKELLQSTRAAVSEVKVGHPILRDVFQSILEALDEVWRK
jgi:hypothetical protein